MPGYSSTKDFLNNSNCTEMLHKTELPNVYFRTNKIFTNNYVPNKLIPNTSSHNTAPRTSTSQEIISNTSSHHTAPGTKVSSDNSKKVCNDLKHIMLKDINSSRPEVWGPGLWFSLHNGALNYPTEPSPLWKERMKNFILGIPVMLPCEKCSLHASAYIESQYTNLDEIVKNRDSIFAFFCNFHNLINERINKPTMSLKDAYELYNNNFNVTQIDIKSIENVKEIEI